LQSPAAPPWSGSVGSIHTPRARQRPGSPPTRVIDRLARQWHPCESRILLGSLGGDMLLVEHRVSVTVASIALAALLLAYGSQAWRSPSPRDFYQFWVPGQAVERLELGNVYSPEDRRRMADFFIADARQSGSPPYLAAARSRQRLELAGTPLLYSVFALTASGDFDRDYARFRWLSLAAYAGSLVALCWMLGYSAPRSAIALLAFTALYWPFHRDIQSSNLGQLQVASLALFLVLERRPKRAAQMAAAALLALGVLFKPTLLGLALLLVPLRISQRDFARLQREGAAFGLAGAIGLALPYLVLDHHCGWLEWLRTFPEILYHPVFLRGSFLQQLLQVQNLKGFTLLNLLLTAAAATAILWTRRRTPQAHGDLDSWFVAAMAVEIYLLSAPTVHSHYFVLLAPALILLLRPGKQLPREARAARYFWALPFAYLLLAAHPGFERLGIVNYPNEYPSHSLLSFAGVWILLAVTLWEWWWVRRSASA
jgi:hypothetical protein